MSIQILLIRHGKTLGNSQRRYIGATDEPLCAEGRRELQEIGIFSDLDIDKIYVSPRKRAIETAAILFPHAQYVIREDLREMDFGDFEGLSPEDLEHDPAYRAWVEGGCLDTCPNGENMADFANRTCEELEKIIQEAVQAGEKHIIIVAHGGSLMSIMHRYSGEPDHYSHWYVDNGGGWLVTLDPQLWKNSHTFCSYETFDPQKIRETLRQ